MTTTIQMDRSGESQVFVTRTGERVFFRRDQDAEGYHVARESDGQPVDGEFANQYREFGTLLEAEQWAAERGYVPAE